LFKPATLSVLSALALVALGISIGEAATKPASLKYKPPQLMGFYSPPMCAQDGGTVTGPTAFCTLKDGYVIKFGDFSDDDCKTDKGRILHTEWGKFCGLPSGYAVKVDMTTSHQLHSN